MKIVNETQYTFEDISFIYKNRVRGRVMVWMRVLLAVAGFYLLSASVDMVMKNKEWFAALVQGNLSLDQYSVMILLMMVAEIVIGILALLICFFYKTVAIKQIYRMYYKNAPARLIEITDQNIEVSHETKGTKSTRTIEYEAVDSFSVEENALFLYIFGSKTKPTLYLAIHDDGYKTGDKEMVIHLLEQKGCKRK